jgi:hypothetical protein
MLANMDRCLLSVFFGCQVQLVQVGKGVAVASQTLAPVYGRLLALHPDVQASEYWLEVKKYTIGRDERSCEIVVKRDTIGRIHAEITAVGAHFLLCDLRSTNGTFVDGERIQDKHLLVHGQEIGLASPEPLFVFEDSGQTICGGSVSMKPSYVSVLRTSYLFYSITGIRGGITR